MFKLFIAGGPFFMSVLTILLVAVFFAAWKAPRWVKEIGSFAMVFGFFSQLLGFLQMFSALEEVSINLKDVAGIFDLIAPSLFLAGMKVSFVPVLYGIIIYMIALIVHIIQKPRL